MYMEILYVRQKLFRENEESVFAAEGADETDKQPGC